MRRRELLAIAGVSLGLAGCWGDKTWRQKLTVTVSTPRGDVSGSSVTEVSMHINRIFKDGARYQYRTRGEAAVVDLGNGKYLFAPLSIASSPDVMSLMVPDMILRSVVAEGKFMRDEAFERLEDYRNPTPVPADLAPPLVMFGDLNDPKSVREVKPIDFTSVFGVGYALKSVTIQITDEPRTVLVVEKLLPWLKDIYPNLLDGTSLMSMRAKNQTANSLGPGDFSTEIRK